MLKLPVDPDEIDHNGNSALTLAAVGGHDDVTRLLLKAGANKVLTGIYGSYGGILNRSWSRASAARVRG